MTQIANDILEIAEQRLEAAMLEAGYAKTDEQAYPWVSPEGTKLTAHAAKDKFSKALPKPAEALEVPSEVCETGENFRNLPEAKKDGKGFQVTASYHFHHDEDAQALHQIYEAQRHVEDTKSEWEEAKENTKECKARYEQALQRLQTTIRKVKQPGEKTLFDYPERPTDTDCQDERIPEGTEIGGEESWRSVLVAEVFSKLPKAVIESLHEKDLRTLGDLQQWLNSGKRLTDLDGVGEAKAEKMEIAMEEFWTRYNQEQTNVAMVAADEHAVSNPDPDDSDSCVPADNTVDPREVEDSAPDSEQPEQDPG